MPIGGRHGLAVSLRARSTLMRCGFGVTFKSAKGAAPFPCAFGWTAGSRVSTASPSARPTHRNTSPL